MAKVSVIVLAAGLSRRMGNDNKMGLLFQGKPIVQHVINQLRESNAFETIIVTSEISQALFTNQNVVLNERYESGMTSSIQTGVQATSALTEGYMICLGDQPLIKTEHYNQIIRTFEESLQLDPQAIVLPTFEGKKGNPVVFSVHYKKAILNHRQPEGCKEIVQANKKHLVFAPLETASILQDVDLPEDYQGLINRESPN